MTKERKVKGSAIIGLVNLVRQFKDRPWHEYLTPEDMEILESMVIPGEWYPIDFIQRLTLAAFKLLAGGDHDLVARFARESMTDIIDGPYRPFIKNASPIEAIDKLIEFRNSLYSFGDSRLEKLGENSARVRIADLGEDNEGVEFFITFQGVQLEELIKWRGGSEVKVTPRKLIEDGEVVIEFDLSWS